MALRLRLALLLVPLHSRIMFSKPPLTVSLGLVWLARLLPLFGLLLLFWPLLALILIIGISIYAVHKFFEFFFVHNLAVWHWLLKFRALFPRLTVRGILISDRRQITGLLFVCFKLPLLLRREILVYCPRNRLLESCTRFPRLTVRMVLTTDRGQVAGLLFVRQALAVALLSILALAALLCGFGHITTLLCCG
jgi:hypothetical protein